MWSIKDFLDRQLEQPILTYKDEDKTKGLGDTETSNQVHSWLISVGNLAVEAFPPNFENNSIVSSAYKNVPASWIAENPRYNPSFVFIPFFGNKFSEKSLKLSQMAPSVPLNGALHPKILKSNSFEAKIVQVTPSSDRTS